MTLQTILIIKLWQKLKKELQTEDQTNAPKDQGHVQRNEGEGDCLLFWLSFCYEICYKLS